MLFTLGLVLGGGFCIHTQAMYHFTINSDGNCDTITHTPYAFEILHTLEQKMPSVGDTPLYTSLLDIYKNLSKQEINVLRNYWKSSDFESELHDERNMQRIVGYAQQLRKDYRDYDLICGLGQSRSYEVLTAQILASLFYEDTSRYLLIAFSGNFKFFDFPTHQLIEHYKNYLQNIGFIDPKNKKIVMCEIVERCKGLTSFIQALRSLHSQGSYSFPEIKFNMHIWGRFYFNGSRTHIVQNSDTRIFSHRPRFDKKESIFQSFPELCWELGATEDSRRRLVSSYYPIDWLITDPLKFKPKAAAIARMLCIIDYIHQHLDDYTLNNSIIQSKL
jgi:hypothetical protein